MKNFIQNALNPGVKVREVLGWAMYDFANSGYTLVVLTAIYAPFFTGVIVGNDKPWGATAWSWALAVSYLIVMLSATTLGQWADRHGAKRRLLMFTTAGCVVTTALLGWTGAGAVALAIGMIILSNTFYSWGEGFIAAFLPELAKREKLGTISGLGWGIGYLGGMLTLGVCLAYILWAMKQGRTEAEYTPVTMWITAGIYGACACVTFALLKERAKPRQALLRRASVWAEIGLSIQSVRAFPDLRQILLSTVFYQGGVAVVIALAAIYAQDVVHMTQQEIILMMFLLNIAAAGGAFMLGFLQDWLGHKLMLIVVLLVWAITCVGVSMCHTKGEFWLAATMAGLCMGSSQSIGRAMVGLFAPEKRLAEFFGLWSLSTRLASIIGLVLFGLLNWMFGARVGVGLISMLFVAGIVMVLPLDVQRGIWLAELQDGSTGDEEKP